VPTPPAGANDRRLQPQNLTAFVHRSLRNLNTDTIDLLQLALPAYRGLLSPGFGILDDLVTAGKLRHYG
jgi:aryl-alcohol dehydrogenase-like predicted oxidoreductase